MLPCTSTLLQRPLGSQDGPVAAAGDFPVWLGCQAVPRLLSSAQRGTGETAGEAEGCWSVLNLVVSGPGVPGLGTWEEEHLLHFLEY